MNSDEQSSSELYTGREQTLIKHFILDRYLERFAHIIGSWAEVITYVDCFSGPWEAQSESLEDTSFNRALKQLRKAKETHAQNNRMIRIRCLFLESKPTSYGKLKEFTDGVVDADVETLNAKFEDSIEQIIAFIRSGGTRSFPFIFIDPTGWTGFALDKIGPLLRLEPSEVLINFMTGHIRRFIESPNQMTQESFEKLFGTAEYRERIAGLNHEDREDALVQAYIQAVAREGKYKYVCPAIVLHPEIDRTHFHLIYATRNLKGVEVFKQVEKQAMKVMEQTRADAQRRKRVKKTGQHELTFTDGPIYDKSHYESLRARYLDQAKKRVLGRLGAEERVLYDYLWEETLSVPLVWESDLKDWIRKWQQDSSIEVDGMGPRERVPKRSADHWIRYRD